VIGSSILLVGAGGHAAACIDVIESGGRFTIAGLVGSSADLGKQLLGYKVLGTDDDLPHLISQHPSALVAVGHIGTVEPRIRLFQQLQRLGYALPAIISPHAHVSRHAALGPGTIVMHGAIVNAGAVIGRNCIINSHALVEHDAVIADHVHIATAAVVNGAVRIGMGTFVGSNATVRQCVTIGERCFIAMGELLRDDCESGRSTESRKRGP
jgi:sugar O-acyltransferase (sialic acid O-acetyltransferase NeuD family)